MTFQFGIRSNSKKCIFQLKFHEKSMYNLSLFLTILPNGSLFSTTLSLSPLEVGRGEDAKGLLLFLKCVISPNLLKLHINWNFLKMVHLPMPTLFLWIFSFPETFDTLLRGIQLSLNYGSHKFTIHGIFLVVSVKLSSSKIIHDINWLHYFLAWIWIRMRY